MCHAPPRRKLDQLLHYQKSQRTNRLHKVTRRKTNQAVLAERFSS